MKFEAIIRGPSRETMIFGISRSSEGRCRMCLIMKYEISSIIKKLCITSLKVHPQKPLQNAGSES